MALITPSDRVDLDRCRFQCESVDRLVPPGIRHFVLVPARDIKHFRDLENHRRTVAAQQDILPRSLRQLPVLRRHWANVRTGPVRGWLIQQLVKLTVGSWIKESIHIHLDSDVVFVRPFDPEYFMRNGRVRLYSGTGRGCDSSHFVWHRTAADLLGIPRKDYFGSNYVGVLNSWRRETLDRLLVRLQEINGQRWVDTVCRLSTFSEYILYGVFAEHVLGTESGHFFENRDLCLMQWSGLDNQAEIQAYLAGLRPEHMAVLVQSNLGLPPDRYREALRRIMATGSQAAETDSQNARHATPQAQAKNLGGTA